MPLVRTVAEGETYEPQPGERLLLLGTTADVPLYVGIRKGEYLIAQPAAEPQPTYILTEEQYVRLEQQVRLQITYQNWLTAGLLTIEDVTTPEPPVRRDGQLPPWATLLPARPGVDQTLPDHEPDPGR